MGPGSAPAYDIESLRRTVHSLTVELLAVYEELSLLYSVSAQIGRLADENQIAAVALKEAIEISTADCGWVALWDGDAFRVHETCRAGIERNAVKQINCAVLEPLFQKQKHGTVSHALPREYNLSHPDAPSRFLASALTLDGRSRGYLCLGRRHTGDVFLSPDHKLISAVALLMAVELENVRLQRSELDKRRLEYEMELARAIQQSLLPRDFSCITFLDAAGISEPCYEIGGDFFDLIPVNASLCTLVVADVSGKGPPAALQVAMMRGVVNAVSRTRSDLPLLMSTLNECLLARSAAERFVTAFAATLTSCGRLHYSNAGHTSPLWIRQDGRVVELAQGGPLLGVFPHSRFVQASVQLAPGDLLVMYTDGVTDAHDCKGNVFGSARLLDWARNQCGRLPQDVKNSLIHAIGNFCGASRPDDDRSVLVVRYTGPGLR